MASVNKVTILGNLGADPEIRSFQNGGKVCNLRIATSETWKDRNSGEKKSALNGTPSPSLPRDWSASPSSISAKAQKFT